MKHLLVWLTGTRFWSWLLLKIFPYIRFSLYYTDFKGHQYFAGYELLQPGDIILTKDTRKLTTLLVGGLWTHAALCVGKGAPYEVAEMTHHNYSKSWFFDICKESDRVCIIRCLNWDVEYTKKVIEKCKSFEGTPYDVAFNTDIKALYCSELVWASDFEKRLLADESDAVGLGRQYISPTDLFEADNIEVVFDSDKIASN